MKTTTGISTLFWIAAAYDGILGVAFALAPASIFERIEITPPNHFGYVQFSAALLIVFALMFIAIARDPLQNKNLIPYGVLLKVSYCSVAFGYWFTQGIPNLWKPFAIVDIVFLVLFLMSYRQLSGASESTAHKV